METIYHYIKDFLKADFKKYLRKINIPILAAKGDNNQIITFQAARS
jgi:hypothetical protein